MFLLYFHSRTPKNQKSFSILQVTNFTFWKLHLGHQYYPRNKTREIHMVKTFSIRGKNKISDTGGSIFIRSILKIYHVFKDFGQPFPEKGQATVKIC